MDRPPYWVGQRLMGLAVASWSEFHGACLMRGVQPLRMPLPWLLDLIYGWAVDGASDKDKAKWHEELYNPPEHIDIDDAPGWDDEELLAGFAATTGKSV